MLKPKMTSSLLMKAALVAVLFTLALSYASASYIVDRCGSKFCDSIHKKGDVVVQSFPCYIYKCSDFPCIDDAGKNKASITMRYLYQESRKVGKVPVIYTCYGNYSKTSSYRCCYDRVTAVPSPVMPIGTIQ